MKQSLTHDEWMTFRVYRGNGGELKEKRSYSGCYHNVGFRVNRGIYITALEFFGPGKRSKYEVDFDSFNEQLHDYKVRVLISRSSAADDLLSLLGRLVAFVNGPTLMHEVLMPEYRVDVKERKVNENFLVTLPQPVYIAPHFWHEIQFELDGPRTGCFKDGFMQGTRKVEGVTFDFSNSSRQLPAMRFLVAKQH